MSAGWSDATVARAARVRPRRCSTCSCCSSPGSSPGASAARVASCGAWRPPRSSSAAAASSPAWLPDVWPIRATLQADRLSYPITYWNTLGLLGAMGWVTCLHLSCVAARAARRPRALRRRAAAARRDGLLHLLPRRDPRRARRRRSPTCSSRARAARPARCSRASRRRSSRSPPAWSADALAADDPATAAAVDQGRTVAIVVVAAMIVAAGAAPRARPARRLGRAAGDPPALARAHARRRGRARRRRRGRRPRRRRRGHAEHAVREVHPVAARSTPPAAPASASPRSATTAASTTGRSRWRARRRRCCTAPAPERTRTSGRRTAPSPSTCRTRTRSTSRSSASSGSSASLLVLALVLTLLGGALLPRRGPDRAVAGAVVAIVLMWALRAGLDWDWEMPVVTVWVLIAGGALLARPAAAAQARGGLVPGRLGRVLLGLGVLVLLITPALVTQSQARLQESIRAFRAGRLPGGARQGAGLQRRALRAARSRSMVIGFCDVRIGQPRLGVEAMQAAVERDPDNWTYRYGLALTKAAAGIDPRPDARLAHEMNPRSQLTRDALERFDTSSPEVWKQRSVTRRRCPSRPDRVALRHTAPQRRRRALGPASVAPSWSGPACLVLRRGARGCADAGPVRRPAGRGPPARPGSPRSP